MKVKYDCHIHSMLSSCADEFMTPNNILNMCMLKGLGLVAVTDHNSLRQHVALSRIAPSYNFLYLYGVEFTTIENFHLLAYFKDLDTALKMETFLEKVRAEKPLVTEHARRQAIFDEYDEEVGYIAPLLSASLTCDTKDLIQRVRELSGLLVLAHIDRANTGILCKNLSLDGLDFDGYEVDEKTRLEAILEKHPLLKSKRMINNSDSHTLVTIHENVELELDELSFEGFARWMKHA